jgi:small acid-soluble spore protein I (minor)
MSMNLTETVHNIQVNQVMMKSEEASMNINLREAIIQRVTDKNDEELFGIIEDSIGGVEQALPGLGVLFEMIWQHSGETEQAQMVTALKGHLAENGANPSP